MTERLTITEFKALNKPNKAKYRNKVCTYEGMCFDSLKERNRYAELLLLERQGFIKDLKRQVKFKLDINGQHIANYIADMTYYQDGKFIVEDVKSPATQTLTVFRIKSKIMLAIHGIEIKIT